MRYSNIFSARLSKPECVRRKITWWIFCAIQIHANVLSIKKYKCCGDVRMYGLNLAKMKILIAVNSNIFCNFLVQKIFLLKFICFYFIFILLQFSKITKLFSRGFSKTFFGSYISTLILFSLILTSNRLLFFIGRSFKKPRNQFSIQFLLNFCVAFNLFPTTKKKLI